MAAEVAAGAYIAAEAIEHTAEAGYAAYIVSKPTLPLKATFSRIATTSGDHTGSAPLSHLRLPHSLTLSGDRWRGRTTP
jgi:hypothetical protein